LAGSFYFLALHGPGHLVPPAEVVRAHQAGQQQNGSQLNPNQVRGEERCAYLPGGYHSRLSARRRAARPACQYKDQFTH
jgi:hypothetical protein